MRLSLVFLIHYVSGGGPVGNIGSKIKKRMQILCVAVDLLFVIFQILKNSKILSCPEFQPKSSLRRRQVKKHRKVRDSMVRKTEEKKRPSLKSFLIFSGRLESNIERCKIKNDLGS